MKIAVHPTQHVRAAAIATDQRATFIDALTAKFVAVSAWEWRAQSARLWREIRTSWADDEIR